MTLVILPITIIRTIIKNHHPIWPLYGPEESKFSGFTPKIPNPKRIKIIIIKKTVNIGAILLIICTRRLENNVMIASKNAIIPANALLSLRNDIESVAYTKTKTNKKGKRNPKFSKSPVSMIEAMFNDHGHLCLDFQRRRQYNLQSVLLQVLW